MIVVDKREKNSLVLAELIEKKCEIRLERLEVADYIINDIAIERKTLPDFVSSMLNKRLLRQLEELKQYPKALLIIEGIDDHPLYEFGKLNPNAIRGMMLSTILNYNIPIILTKNYEDTAEFLILLEKRQEGTKEISLKAKRRAFNLAEQQRFILESFPGIGPATAKTLLKKFKTIKAIINAEDKELEKVINKKKIAVIKKIINSKYVS
ncbi:MAG: helix-hairpin-helix domain-containing protein [Candidatus Pacearchaeota archaeon]|nr:helix-hairpin-helix domain-containing protein [Candidatus Pacearchaeota archaeon]